MIGSFYTRYLKFKGTLKTKRPFKNHLKSKTLSLPHLFHHPRYINRQNRAFQSSYKKCHPTYKTYNLVHSNFLITTRFYFILMVTVTKWYEPISSSRVTGCVGPRLVREHHSGAHHSSPPAPIGSVSSPLWWCTKAPTTPKIYIST